MATAGSLGVSPPPHPKAGGAAGSSYATSLGSTFLSAPLWPWLGQGAGGCFTASPASFWLSSHPSQGPRLAPLTAPSFLDPRSPWGSASPSASEWGRPWEPRTLCKPSAPPSQACSAQVGTLSGEGTRHAGDQGPGPGRAWVPAAGLAWSSQAYSMATPASGPERPWLIRGRHPTPIPACCAPSRPLPGSRPLGAACHHAPLCGSPGASLWPPGEL